MASLIEDRPDAENAINPKSPQKATKQSFDYLWRSGLAGGLAGCVAKTLVAPIDRVKILFQSRNALFLKYTGSWSGFGAAIADIYHRDGTTALFRGHSATLLRIFPSAGIRFLSYEQYRAILIPAKAQETSFRRLIAGSLAGVTSVLFTYPLEVVRVRLAFETKTQHSTIFSICKQIYQEPATGQSSSIPTAKPWLGVLNFYRGLSPTLLGIIPYAGMSFLTYDVMGDIMRVPALARWTCRPRTKDAPSEERVQLTSWAKLTSGGAAGLVAQTASYPLEVIRRRMQVSGATGGGQSLHIREVAMLIMRERGLSGFYIGLTLGYIKIVPMFAVSFFVYERVKSLLEI